MFATYTHALNKYSNLKHGDYITPYKGTDVVKRTVYLTVKKFLEFYTT